MARMAPVSATGLPLAGGLTHGLPVGGLTQSLPLAGGGLGNLSNLSNLSAVPLAGPALSGLTTEIVPMNGMLPQATGLPTTNSGVPAAALAPAAAPAPAVAPAPPAAAPAAHAPAPAAPARPAAHPATRSRKAVGTPHTAPTPPVTPMNASDGVHAGPRLLAGMPMMDTPLGPDAPSLSQLPQYTGVKKMGLSDVAPVLAAQQAANLAAPAAPTLPVIGELPDGGLTGACPRSAV
ncbi:hypothetical protein ACFQ9X_04525 [Catenulispora yoronensis]